jgi:hypothetical protein
MDELAESVGTDAVEFRRQFMGNHPRHLAVLNAAADAIGWTKPAPKGVFRGIAQMKAYGSFVAAACELSVKDGNKVKIHRMVAATDPGYAVNPAQIERQVSGSFVYGLSALFEQECTVKDGRIEQKNFDTYNSIRLAQMRCDVLEHELDAREDVALSGAVRSHQRMHFTRLHGEVDPAQDFDRGAAVRVNRRVQVRNGQRAHDNSTYTSPSATRTT